MTLSAVQHVNQELNKDEQASLEERLPLGYKALRACAKCKWLNPNNKVANVLAGIPRLIVGTAITIFGFLSFIFYYSWKTPIKLIDAEMDLKFPDHVLSKQENDKFNNTIQSERKIMPCLLLKNQITVVAFVLFPLIPSIYESPVQNNQPPSVDPLLSRASSLFLSNKSKRLI